jgi:protein gp37
MSENTAIEYATHTFNPWIGCGHNCPYCYAKRWARRFPRYRGCFGPESEPVITSYAAYKKLHKWNAQAAREHKRFRILPSLCDPFEEDTEFSLDAPRTKFFSAIESTPNLTYLLLTKAPWNVEITDPNRIRNIWLGTSVENQLFADSRIPPLLRLKHPQCFLSLEPLLGPVNLKPWLHGIHWVIAGGQTGPDAAPMHPDWVRSIRDQCADANVPFYFKQWGEWGTNWYSMQTGEPVFKKYESEQQWINKPQWIKGGTCLDMDGKILRIGKHFSEARYPVAIMQKIGKKKAGRTLDGHLHLDMPQEIL